MEAHRVQPKSKEKHMRVSEEMKYQVRLWFISCRRSINDFCAVYFNEADEPLGIVMYDVLQGNDFVASWEMLGVKNPFETALA